MFPGFIVVDGGYYVQKDVLCGAYQQDCKKLYREI